MSSIPVDLNHIAEELSSGRKVNPVTTREFLSWFDAQRRGYWIVTKIRAALEAAGILTVPDFESAYIDSTIEFKLVHASDKPKKSKRKSVNTDMPQLDVTVAPPPVASWLSVDPTYRISKLAAANQAIVSVKPDATLAEAITLMMARDLSQLPVMPNERDIKGVISWRSIGSRLVLGATGATVNSFTDAHQEISSDLSIFDAIPIVVMHDYVLVRNAPDRKITGIITASDLSVQFRQLSEPFLLLAEIENLIRSMIGDRFTATELAVLRDPSDSEREIESVANLTFGEYVRLLEEPNRWRRIGIAVDRATFCADLDQVRRVRNDVMHFDPDGIAESDLSKLRDFTNFLKRLQAVAPDPAS